MSEITPKFKVGDWVSFDWTSHDYITRHRKGVITATVTYHDRVKYFIRCDDKMNPIPVILWEDRLKPVFEEVEFRDLSEGLFDEDLMGS